MNRAGSLLFLILLLMFVSSCTSTASSTTPQPIVVQYTAATTPRLAELYTCAGDNVVTAELRSADFLDPQSVDMVIRIGEPRNLSTPAYQIDDEKILVIVNQQNTLHKLTLDQVRGLFSGQIVNWKDIDGNDAPVQVWVFSAGEDVQRIFNQVALGGSPVTANARLATSPEEMVEGISGDVNAIGILTNSWDADNVSSALTVTSVPVLAITSAEPQGVIQQVIACLQK